MTGNILYNRKSTSLVYLKRTDADDKDFQSLVILLDEELLERDGEDHVFYAQFNSIGRIRHVIVAYREGQAVGCGAFKLYNERTAEIKRMFVRAAFRGQGIAGQILTELESWAQENNFHQCILETGFNQPEAIALYQKSGYSRIPNYGQYQGVAGSICMQKALAAQQ
jgi:putative acetyltransferase